MVTMPTTPDWKKQGAEERAAAIRVMQAYAGMATAMDREVGRLVAHLKAAGDYDNTIFVFLSDNGAEPTDPFASLRNRLFLDMQYDLATANIGRRGKTGRAPARTPFTHAQLVCRLLLDTNIITPN